MPKLSRVLRAFDFFGIGLNFNYKSDKTYKSVIGGVLSILFLVTCSAYFIVSINVFISNRPISVISYSKDLNKTDTYSFSHLKTGIAFKLISNSNKYGNIDKLLEIKMYYRVVTRNNNGTRISTKTPVRMHKCKYEDFYNLLNESMDVNKITNNFYCPDMQNNITGIYSDKLYKFYQIEIKLKNETKHNLVEKILYDIECDFSFYFTNFAIDVTNQIKPVSVFLNSKYTPITPDTNKKIDYFFKIKDFESYESYIFDLSSKNQYGSLSKEEYNTISRNDDRYKNKVDDYNVYTKIYLRADTSRGIIERRSKKLTELIADISSLLSYVFIFLTVLIKYFNYKFVINSVLNNLYRINKNDSINKKKIKEIVQEESTIKKNKKIQEDIIGIRDEKSFDDLDQVQSTERKRLYSKHNKQKSKIDTTVQSNPSLNITENISNTALKNKKYFGQNFLVNKLDNNNEKSPKTKIIIGQNDSFSQITSTSTNNEFFNIINKNEFSSSINSGFKRIKQNLILDKKKLGFNCHSKKKNEKSLLLEEIRASFHEKLNIINYLKYIQSIQLLSYIVLNQDENFMLKYLSKVYFKENKNIYNYLAEEGNENIKKMGKQFLFKFYLLLNKEDKTEVENKLSKLYSLNPNIIKYSGK